METNTLIANVGDVTTIVTDVMQFFTTPPVSYFVAFALVGAGVGIVRKLVPRKKG